MARYLILGAGKFGRLALARLARQEAAASFQVVEHRPEALAAARALALPEVEWVAAEAIAFLAANLRDNPPWDWLIPMVPVHVACAWLLAGPLNGLAIVYWRQSKYAEAVGLYKRALAIREQALGPNHPDVGATLDGLAIVYADQGKYAEAEGLYQRALAIKERAPVLGDR